MKSESAGPVLSTVFVDYDNIYLSLKRKSEDAAKRFAKDAGLWLREIESGRLISSSTGANFNVPRRIVMTRCYGNPVPRRNSNDNSTDMNSFPFVRHHFLRAGFEVIDCPPLTAQLKNSADIRMVMDVRDVLNHDTRFDEFILLSGDADFTPVLHRLRAHARRTVVFANDHTAAPYTAIADGEVRESDLIALLLDGRISDESEPRVAELRAPTGAELEVVRKEIVAEVVASVRAAAQPVPLEALADRAVRALGHDKTVGSAWGGAGSFRDLLAKGLPGTIRLTDQPPYYAYETTRQIAQSLDTRPEPREPLRERRNDAPEVRQEVRPEVRGGEMRAGPRTDGRPDLRYDLRAEPQRDSRFDAAPEVAPPRQDRMLPPAAARPAAPQNRPLAPQDNYGEAYAARPQQQAPAQPVQAAPRRPVAPQPQAFAPAPQQAAPVYAPQQNAPAYAPQQPLAPRSGLYPGQEAPAAPRAQAPQARGAENATQLQQSIARIHEACQAPPLSPPEYRVLFEVMAEEINANNLSGAQTLVNIGQRAQEVGLDIKRDDIRFVLEVVSEADPWFEQGASSVLFASRFRNFVVARCRGQGLSLSADEIDLIDAWFGGAGAPAQRAPDGSVGVQAQVGDHMNSGPNARQGGERWATYDDGRQQQNAPQSQGGGFGAEADEEFPRIVRSGLRR
jgi:hypothetical protein